VRDALIARAQYEAELDGMAAGVRDFKGHLLARSELLAANQIATSNLGDTF
jgi:hypothetical protein